MPEISPTPNTPPHDPFFRDVKYAEEKIAQAREALNVGTPAYEALKGEYGHLIDLSDRLNIPLESLITYETQIGTRTLEQYLTELEAKGIQISDYAKDMLQKMELTTTPESLQLVRLTVADLGFPQGATTDQIYERITTLGLELCPQETGPALRLSTDSPELMRIGMKPITDRGRYPFVFRLHRGGGDLWLDDSWAKPDYEWSAGSHWVFRLRKSES